MPCVLHVRAVLSEEVPLAYPNNLIPQNPELSDGWWPIQKQEQFNSAVEKLGIGLASQQQQEVQCIADFNK